MKRYLFPLFLALLLTTAFGIAFVSCDDDDDDNDNNDDTAGEDDDDTADDDDATPADDDATPDDDDDTTPGDDDDDDATPTDDDDDDDTTPTGDPWVDGGFNEDTWEPCAGAGCTAIAYATVSQIFQVQQFSDAAMIGQENHQILLWSMPGDTVAGDLDLTLPIKEKDIVLDTFVLLFVNATIKMTGAIEYEAAYISSAGTMHIDQIGQTMGAAFQGELQNVDFLQAELNGNMIEIIQGGKTGHIGSVNATGVTITVPQK